MKTLRLTKSESTAYAAGERRFWRAMRYQPYDCGSDGMGGFVAVYLEPPKDAWLNDRPWPIRCPYGTTGDRIEVIERDCPGCVHMTIAAITVEQRDGKWGWVVEVSE